MAQPRRKNEPALSALRAVGIALLTAIGLTAMSARPAWLPVAVGAVVGAVALASTELAVLAAVIALSMPLIAVQPVVGIVTLILLVVCVRYLGTERWPRLPDTGAFARGRLPRTRLGGRCAGRLPARGRARRCSWRRSRACCSRPPAFLSVVR